MSETYSWVEHARVGTDGSGKPVYMWELPQDVLIGAARVQRLQDELDALKQTLGEHESSLRALFGYRWPSGGPSARDLRSRVHLAEARLLREIRRQEETDE